LTIGYIGQLPLSLGLGIIYDIYGRRKPLFASWILAALALIVYPFATNRYVYYFINLCVVPLTATGGMPFIPDLIKEEGQPIVIFLVVICKAVGLIVLQVLLKLVSSEGNPLYGQ